MPGWNVLSVELLDRFRLVWGDTDIPVPRQGATLVAFLALHDRPVHRSTVAGTLWPTLPEAGALTALRSALHRIDAPVVAATGEHLTLEPDVQIDLRRAVTLARDLLHSTVVQTRIEPILDTLKRELLPDDESLWIEPEREHFRHLRLAALGALATGLTVHRRYAEAVEAAQLATAIEPTSEVAESALIGALLEEGNEALAVREYEAFRKRLWQEFRIRPVHDLDGMRPHRGPALARSLHPVTHR